MLVTLDYAIGLVVATVLVHVACSAVVIAWLRSLHRQHWAVNNAVNRALVLGALVLIMSLAAFLESALWAGCYVRVGALAGFGESLYFSLVTFTTLGYGDITLNEDWRILGAFQAANGILMFGWTTALIVAVAHRLLVHRFETEGGF